MKFAFAAIAMTATFATSAFAAGGTPGAGFLDEWDMNTDGEVTVEDVASRRSDIFVSFDADDNGVLDAEEYAFFDNARETGHSEEGGNGAGHGGDRKAAVGMTLEFNDVDGDGSVTLEEFLGQSAAWLAMVDRNGDGIVDSSDFGPRG